MNSPAPRRRSSCRLEPAGTGVVDQVLPSPDSRRWDPGIRAVVDSGAKAKVCLAMRLSTTMGARGAVIALEQARRTPRNLGVTRFDDCTDPAIGELHTIRVVTDNAPASRPAGSWASHRGTGRCRPRPHPPRGPRDQRCRRAVLRDDQGPLSPRDSDGPMIPCSTSGWSRPSTSTTDPAARGVWARPAAARLPRRLQLFRRQMCLSYLARDRSLAPLNQRGVASDRISGCGATTTKLRL